MWEGGRAQGGLDGHNGELEETSVGGGRVERRQTRASL